MSQRTKAKLRTQIQLLAGGRATSFSETLERIEDVRGVDLSQYDATTVAGLRQILTEVREVCGG